MDTLPATKGDMYIDRIDLSLPEALVSSVLSAFASAESQLTALPSLSPSDRKHLAKLGLKNEGLARQIIEVGRSNPELIPRGIHFEQIDRDLVAREQLLALKLVIERLLGKVNDAMQLTGVDIYAAALSIYHCLKRNADKASVKGVVDELKKGFARPSRKKAEPQPAPVPAPVPAAPTAVVMQVAEAAPSSSGGTLQRAAVRRLSSVPAVAERPIPEKTSAVQLRGESVNACFLFPCASKPTYFSGNFAASSGYKVQSGSGVPPLMLPEEKRRAAAATLFYLGATPIR